MKYILAILCCLVSTCGTFDASYTDPKTGATYHGGVTVPNKTTSDAK